MASTKPAPKNTRCTVTSATVKTLKQLRTPEPYVWEVGWLLANYHNRNKFYYLIAKPNGWELGKRDSQYTGGQRFLATGTNIQTPIGVPRNLSLRIRQVKGAVVIVVKINNKTVTRYVDKERPYPAKRMGAYAEDADVLFDNALHRTC